MPASAPRFSPARRLLAGARRWLPVRFLPWAGRLTAGRRRELAATTRTCSESLLEFGRRSDEEFTALAQGLAQLSQHLAGRRQQHAAFQLVLEDRDTDRPLASAQEVYQRSVDLVHSSIGIASSEQEQMKAIESALLTAGEANGHFQRNQLLLRIITLRIRMEAARMEPEHQSTFLNVGDAIGDINQKIIASTESAFQRIDAVVAETRTERALMREIERDLHTRARSSIGTIQHELAALQTALAPCAQQGRALAELFARAEAVTFRTLSSLQHQDIVRQQLEHVAAGFTDLHEHLDGARRTGAADRLELGYIHHATGVQQAHLSSARQEIEHATADVVAGLHSLLDASTALVDQVAGMQSTSSAAFADFRIVTMFREEIRRLAEVADKSKEANAKISRLVGRIEEVVRFFAGEVGHYELDVKIVALNAQIAAARVPSADALNRLAEETTRVSDDNTAVTRQLLADLEVGLVQLRAIKESADKFLHIVTEEKAELESGVEAVTGKLTRLGGRVRADLAQVRESFGSVHGRIEELLGQVGLAALIEASFPPAEQLCASLLAASVDHSDRAGLSKQAASRLEAHRDRYTMEKENATHATVLAGAPVATDASAVVAGGVDPGPEFFEQTTGPDPTASLPRPATVAGVALATGGPAKAADPGPASARPATAPTPAGDGPAKATEDLGDGIELF